MSFAGLNYRWLVPQHEPALVHRLSVETGASILAVKCLLNRGFKEVASIAQFLEPRLKLLSDPFLLPNMESAVDRLYAARAKGERLVIFGDYDVDGVTSTAVLSEVLGALGWKTEAYLPNRLEEGYGLSQESVENCLKKFPTSLLLAVDCGSTSVTVIQWLEQRGIDVIVLDHHQLGETLPPARALVNPQLGQHLRELCSAGLAFKLSHALVKRGRQIGLAEATDYDIRLLLDLVALGTIADQVPLTGENRTLVSAGLERLNASSRPGILALKKVANVQSTMSVFEVAFQLAPRLNASGRLENATKSLDLLRAKTQGEAEPVALELDRQNRERQQIERRIVDEVIEIIRAKFDADRDYVIVEGRDPWHVGVVGIVASRVLREFNRPTIIVGCDGEEWRGSGRSIQGFDLAAALRDCGDLLVKHGGHAMAAGLTVHPDRIEGLRLRLNDLARKTLTKEQLRPSLQLDAEVTLPDLSLERVKELDSLSPFGQGNPSVQCSARNIRLQRPPQRMGKEQQHLKMWLTNGDGRTVREAVWWNCGQKSPPAKPFDIAFVPGINAFNGRQTVQLRVLDLQESV